MGVREHADNQTIEFTYKLEEGHSLSYAMNVARMAQIPEKVISRAIEKSQSMNNFNKSSN